jgi:hypothetical protein
VALLFLTAACGGAAPMAKAESPAVAAAPPPPAPPSVVAGAPAGPASPALLAMNDVAANKSVPDSPHSAAMLIYTANITMAVYQVETALQGVEQAARDAGGYLSVRLDTSITVRVPRDRFDDAIARIEKLGDVTHRDIKAQDVTDEYVDLQARLKNAYAMRDRLTELLARAAVKEAIDIEKELGRVTEEIERMEGRMKLLRDQIAFSTITVSFNPLAPDRVRESSMLNAFPWLQNLGLGSLLDVH